MTSRFDTRLTLVNNSSQYSEFLSEKNLKFIKQYATVKMRHPSAEQFDDLEIITHIWKVGDRYYKLANEYYQDSKLWWVIAHFNQKPTEADVRIGDAISIPMPLERVLEILGY